MLAQPARARVARTPGTTGPSWSGDRVRPTTDPLPRANRGWLAECVGAIGLVSAGNRACDAGELQRDLGGGHRA
jgi:hypothetical protein